MTLARVVISIQGKYSCLKTQGSEVSLKNLARVKVYFLSKLFINSNSGTFYLMRYQVHCLIGQYKMRTADCCRLLFSPCKWERDNNSPTMVCSQSTVCILYSSSCIMSLLAESKREYCNNTVCWFSAFKITLHDLEIQNGLCEKTRQLDYRLIYDSDLLSV